MTQQPQAQVVRLPAQPIPAPDATPFALDAIMPSQWKDRTTRLITPAHRLFLALLEDAMHILWKYQHTRSAKGEIAYRETWHWLHENDPVWPCSFQNVCQYLDLEPGYIRAHIRRRGILEPPRHAHHGRVDNRLKVGTRPR